MGWSQDNNIQSLFNLTESQHLHYGDHLFKPFEVTFELFILLLKIVYYCIVKCQIKMVIQYKAPSRARNVCSDICGSKNYLANIFTQINQYLMVVL